MKTGPQIRDDILEMIAKAIVCSLIDEELSAYVVQVRNEAFKDGVDSAELINRLKREDAKFSKGVKREETRKRTAAQRRSKGGSK